MRVYARVNIYIPSNSYIYSFGENLLSLLPPKKLNRRCPYRVDILEKEIEKKLKARLERLGCMVLKFTSPGNAGVPDRLVLVPGGTVWFVELKRPGGKLRPLQEIWRDRIEGLKGNYRLVQSEKDIDQLCTLIEAMNILVNCEYRSEKH